MTLRRLLVLAAIAVTAIVLGSTVLAQVRVFGVRPDLVLLTVFAVGMAGGPSTGAGYGFCAGLLTDLLLQLPVGVSAIIYTTVGYGAGVARRYVTSPRPWVPMLLAAGVSTVAFWAYGVALRAFGVSGFSWAFVLRSGVLVGCYNLLLTPLVYPVVRSLVARSAVVERAEFR